MDGPKRIVIKLDPTKPEMLRYVKETVEAHRGNGSAAEVFLHVPQGQELHVVRTPLLAEFNEPFRAAIERLLGRRVITLVLFPSRQQGGENEPFPSPLYPTS